MTLDFTTMPPPEEWDRFNSMIQRRMPRPPETGGGASAVGDICTFAGAGMSGAGGVPIVGDAIGIGCTVYGASTALADGDVAGALSTVGDDLISRGADMILSGEGGWLVGGLIMVARGAHQALDRSDQMVTYLNSMGGYIHTLVRAAIAAINDPYPYTRMPMPVVPDYVERTGDLYSEFTRAAFTNGYNRVAEIVRDIDSVRRPGGDYPSKRCLMHIGLQTNMTGGSSAGSAALRLQMRQRAERYVVRDLLHVDLASQAEALRRWANEH